MVTFISQYSSEIITSLISVVVTVIVGWYFWWLKKPKTLDWILEADTQIVPKSLGPELTVSLGGAAPLEDPGGSRIHPLPPLVLIKA